MVDPCSVVSSQGFMVKWHTFLVPCPFFQFFLPGLFTSCTQCSRLIDCEVLKGCAWWGGQLQKHLANIVIKIQMCISIIMSILEFVVFLWMFLLLVLWARVIVYLFSFYILLFCLHPYALAISMQLPHYTAYWIIWNVCVENVFVCVLCSRIVPVRGAACKALTFSCRLSANENDLSSE